MVTKQPLVTLFPTLMDINHPSDYPPLEVLESIKSKTNQFQHILKEIQNAPHTIANQLKLALPPICFSGTFSKRDDSGLLQYSQLVCIDVDDVSDLNTLKKELKQVPYVYSCFVSPSGKGLKILVFHDCPDHSRHGDIYWHIGEQLGLTGRSDLTFDTHCSNISRACFFSYDPNLVINSKAETLKVDVSALKPRPKPSASLSSWDSLPTIPSVPIPSTVEELKKLKESLVKDLEQFERFYSFYPGIRNRNLNILVCKLRSNGYPEELVSIYLQLYYGGQHSDFTTAEIKRCVSSVYGFK